MKVKVSYQDENELHEFIGTYDYPYSCLGTCEEVRDWIEEKEEFSTIDTGENNEFDEFNFLDFIDCGADKEFLSEQCQNYVKELEEIIKKNIEQ